MYAGVCVVICFQFPLTSQTPFFPLLCISDCQSLPPFSKKEMGGENVPTGKYSSSLFILVMGLQLLNAGGLIKDSHCSLTDLTSKPGEALL